MRIILSVIFVLFCDIICFSQTVKKVKSEYTYLAPETQSVGQAKDIALERAKIQIIADEFGTTISQTNYTDVKNRNGISSIDFQSVGMSDLRGEWIETIGNPIYTISYSDGVQSVNVQVEGRIRSLSKSYADINVKLLRNQPDIRFESNEFHNNDDLFIRFVSPIDGYLTIYLLDEDGNAFCLLPYAKQSNGIFRVTANKEYMLFSKNNCSAVERNIVDEYIMTCGAIPEYNKIAIVFSDNHFVKSNDSGTTSLMPRQLPSKDFHKWVAKSRSSDLNMQYIEIPFKIIP